MLLSYFDVASEWYISNPSAKFTWQNNKKISQQTIDILNGKRKPAFDISMKEWRRFTRYIVIK